MELARKFEPIRNGEMYFEWKIHCHKRISELSTIPQYFLYLPESRIPKPTSHGLKAVICDVGSTKTNVRQVRTTCSILHKMANSSISYLELNHWWHYSERWQHDNRCRLEDGLAPLIQKLRELRYSSFFFLHSRRARLCCIDAAHHMKELTHIHSYSLL